MDLADLHKEMNSTFMGHNIDGVIIQPPMGQNDSDELKLWQQYNREYALKMLNQEASYFWDKKK